jgi:hypothetical protein
VVTDDGKAGGVNICEPSVMPRESKPRRWVVVLGLRDRALKGDVPRLANPADRVGTAVPPGYRGQTTRPHLVVCAVRPEVQDR